MAKTMIPAMLATPANIRVMDFIMVILSFEFVVLTFGLFNCDARTGAALGPIKVLAAKFLRLSQ
jgi:hypothetical protein